MRRANVPALVVLLLSVTACRLGFDPVDADGADGPNILASVDGGLTTMSATITAQPGSEFVTTCAAGQPCQIDCTAAAACIVSCNGASSCDVECGTVDCVVDACVTPACEVSCASGPPLVFGATATCD